MARTGLTRLDWVAAGQALLIDGGIDAVKLQRMTERLDVTTGSFYHHFRNLDEFLCALADYYGSKQAQRLIDQARDAVGTDPDAVLRESTTLFGRGSMRQLNIAMRAWAHRDQRAAAAVRRFDRVLMGILDQLFLDMGFDEMAAKSRTLIMMGLASLDFEPEVMQPTYQERWAHIRTLITQR